MPKKTKFGDKDIAKGRAIVAALNEARAAAKLPPRSYRQHVFGHGCSGLYLHTNPPSERYPEGRQKWILRYSRPGKAGVTEKSPVTEKRLAISPTRHSKGQRRL